MNETMHNKNERKRISLRRVVLWGVVAILAGLAFWQWRSPHSLKETFARLFVPEFVVPERDPARRPVNEATSEVLKSERR